MNITAFPARGVHRLEALKTAIRAAGDLTRLTTVQVVALCERALPDATVDEMIAALRQVGEEHHEEATELIRFVAKRKGAS